jgi:spermidine/putrescine transport system ATP-binding protein
MDDAPVVAIECRNLVKRFAGTTSRVLDDVSLAIKSGEFFTLLGPSGCGKTTLLRVIGGFERQESGSVLLDGQTIDRLPPYRRPINTVFQSYAVFPHMSVRGNIAFGLQMQGTSRAEIARRVAEMVSLVRLDGYEDRRPDQLSGGQQQRIALARALAAGPRVLLLDEPLSALDLKLRIEMQSELKRLQTEIGITFVFVTHDQNEALALSDRIAVMRSGKVLQVGSPQDIYERPTSRFVADFIGESNFLRAERVGADRFRLACGIDLTVTAARACGAVDQNSIVTLAIRPERVRIAEHDGTASLPGMVEQIVYIGTDTTYHLRLADGTPFVVRAQNRDGITPSANRGAQVGVCIPPQAVHILND